VFSFIAFPYSTQLRKGKVASSFSMFTPSKIFGTHLRTGFCERFGSKAYGLDPALLKTHRPYNLIFSYRVI